MSRLGIAPESIKRAETGCIGRVGRPRTKRGVRSLCRLGAGLSSPCLRDCAVRGGPADAEDIAQDAFLKAFAAIDTCRDPARFGAWLFQIVRNQARNFLESRSLREVVTDGQRVLEPVSRPPESAGMRAALLSALADLDAKEREVILLHDLERWTHAEIGQALDISEVYSRQHLFRARQVLRTKLGGVGSTDKNEGSHER